MTLTRVEPGIALALVERADVLSEGRDDAGHYFGTSNVEIAVDDIDTARALSVNVHVRTAIVRIARREAASRTNGVLGTLSCHVAVELSASKVVFVVEVEAALDAPRAAFA